MEKVGEEQSDFLNRYNIREYSNAPVRHEHSWDNTILYKMFIQFRPDLLNVLFNFLAVHHESRESISEVFTEVVVLHEFDHEPEGIHLRSVPEERGTYVVHSLNIPQCGQVDRQSIQDSA